MYDWNDLKCFLAVARAGSTLGAARTLGLNQSTVARRIDALENALDTQLFERRPGGYRLTGKGRDLLPLAEAAEARHAAIADATAAWRRAVSGTVRVTTTELLATEVLAPLVSHLRATHPALQVELVADDRRLDLMRNEVDVTIRLGDAPSEASLVRRHVGDSVWALFASKEYAAKRGLPAGPEDFAGHAIIGGSGNLARLPTLEWLASLAPQAEIAMRCNSVPNLIAAVRSGVAIGPLPCLAAARDPNLLRCLGPGYVQRTKIWLVYHESQRNSPHMRAFVEGAVGRIKSMRDVLERDIAH